MLHETEKWFTATGKNVHTLPGATVTGSHWLLVPGCRDAQNGTGLSEAFAELDGTRSASKLSDVMNRTLVLVIPGTV
jgi:hypothetical protein